LPVLSRRGKGNAAEIMEVQKRLGSITSLLVGLVLLVTVAGTFMVFVPVIDCPESVHYGDHLGWKHFHCRRCDSWVDIDANKVSLWRKWHGVPPPERDEFELYRMPR
jgi:hypothetical protein